MSVPHTCPRCEGEQQVPDPRTRELRDCPTCHGSGVVWEKDGQPQEAAVGGGDPLDINGL